MRGWLEHKISLKCRTNANTWSTKIENELWKVSQTLEVWCSKFMHLVYGLSLPVRTPKFFSLVSQVFWGGYFPWAIGFCFAARIDHWTAWKLKITKRKAETHLLTSIMAELIQDLSSREIILSAKTRWHSCCHRARRYPSGLVTAPP